MVVYLSLDLLWIPAFSWTAPLSFHHNTHDLFPARDREIKQSWYFDSNIYGRVCMFMVLFNILLSCSMHVECINNIEIQFTSNSHKHPILDSRFCYPASRISIISDLIFVFPSISQGKYQHYNYWNYGYVMIRSGIKSEDI